MIAVGSSSGICSDSDDAGRRQSSQAWGHEMTCFHTSGTAFARLLEDETQLCDLPTSHNTFCHDLMISYDLDPCVLWDLIYRTHCSYFIDIACLKAQMLTICLFQTTAYLQPLPFTQTSKVQKMYCSVNHLSFTMWNWVSRFR